MSSPSVRITALNAAVEVMKLFVGDTIIDDAIANSLTPKIIATAKRFELYLETGIDAAAQLQNKEVTGAKSQLVQAIKAQGGVETQTKGG